MLHATGQEVGEQVVGDEAVDLSLDLVMVDDSAVDANTAKEDENNATEASAENNTTNTNNLTKQASPAASTAASTALIARNLQDHFSTMMERPDDLLSRFFFEERQCPITDVFELKQAPIRGESSTVHVDVALPSSIEYKLAETAEILPENPVALVDEFLALFGISPEESDRVRVRGENNVSTYFMIYVQGSWLLVLD
jgi:sulfite reductase alpha subunit-like flavoprotein